MTSTDRFSKVCRHCGAGPLKRDSKGRWIAHVAWADSFSRFCPRPAGTVARMEHAPVPLWNQRKLDAWLASEPLMVEPLGLPF